MPVFEIKEAGADFTPHPPGPAEFICVHVTDQGMEDRNPFGGEPRHRVIFRLQSISHAREDGSPCLVNVYSSVSSWHTSGFVTIRERLAGRKLERAELTSFDTKSVEGVRLSGIVTHKAGKSGAYAQVSPESMYRLPDQNKGVVWSEWDWDEADQKARDRAKEANGDHFSTAGGQAQSQQPVHAQSTGNDDLPF